MSLVSLLCTAEWVGAERSSSGVSEMANGAVEWSGTIGGVGVGRQ